MQRILSIVRRSPWLWISIGLTFLVGGVSLATGSFVWFVSLLAIDPEDQVPTAWYAVPFAVGGVLWGSLAIGLYGRWVLSLVRGLRTPTGALDVA